jgi:hypothetical protein
VEKEVACSGGCGGGELALLRTDLERPSSYITNRFFGCLALQGAKLAKEVIKMAKFLLFHTIDLRTADLKAYTTEAQMSSTKGMVDAFTADTCCITTWIAVGAGKAACLWEAPSEQAIIDVYAKGSALPVDGIHPATVIDWAEMKKALGA